MQVRTIQGILLGAVIGVAIGIGIYTFAYAKGWSYLTDNPAACANCHIIREQFDGWLKSSHRQIDRTGSSKHRWIVGGNLCLLLNQWGLVAAWTYAAANVVDNTLQGLIRQLMCWSRGMAYSPTCTVSCPSQLPILVYKVLTPLVTTSHLHLRLNTTRS